MNTKSKIAVGLIVFILIVFGFIINGIAANVSTTYVPDLNGATGGSDLNDLARIAAKHGNYYNAQYSFFEIPASQLYDRYINQAPSAVWYRSGMCMYHMQSTGSWSDYGKFYIYNVLDFDLVDGELELKNNGVPVTNTNASTWTVAKILNGIWNNSPAYDDAAAQGGIYSNEWKDAGLYAFYVANNHNNLGNINSNYIGTRSYTGGATTKYTNSQSYGTEAHNYRKITKVTTTPTAVNNGDYTVIGPLKIKYGLKDVDRVTIKSGSNSVSTGIYYTTDSYSSAEDVANNISNVSKSTRLYNIPSNDNFYLIVSDPDQRYVQDSGVKVTIRQETFKYYKARLVLAGKKVADAQQVGIFASDEKTYNGSVSWDIDDIIKDNFKIIINKKNEDAQPASGATFKIEVLEGMNHKGWLNYSGNNYDYNSSSAQTWRTNSSGKIEIRGLSADYNYKVYEVSTPSGYLGLEYQIAAGMTVNGSTLDSGAYDSTNGIMCGTAEGSETVNEVTFNIKNIKRYLEININKKDEIGRSDYVDGAEFKIYVENTGKWLGYSSGRYTYNESFTSAKSWRISGGTVRISGLIADNKYKVYETKQPDNFLALDEQIEAGIKITVGGTNITPTYEAGNGIYCGTVQYSGGSPIVGIDVENREEYLDISGIIWEDNVGNKSDDYDSKYNNSSEELYNKEVKVTLLDSSNNVVGTVTTNDGTYTFNTDITVTRTMSDAQVGAKLNGYYLKFEYASEAKEENSIISYYGTVAPGEGLNTSKALPLKDKEKDGVAYIYKLSDYVSTDYDFHELKNMNMGLVLMKDQYDYDVNQVIDHVKVWINGYTYTYKYGESARKEASAVPTVRWDNGWAYSRPIYPSDIAYSVEHGWASANSLKVYVVYRIDIQDGTINDYDGKPKSAITGKKQVSYVEKSLKVESLINDFDINRYELEGSNSISSDSDFDDWEYDVGGYATYKGNKFDTEIDTEETRSVKIQFKVKDNALETLLTASKSAEDKPTIAKANAYHNYWKSYNAWDGTNRILAKPDLTTATVEEESESIALVLELGTERQIKGTVFEDKAVDTGTGEELGNGKKDSTENVVSNVKVELLSEDKTTIAKVYKQTGSDPYYEELNAETTSATNGEYTIGGMTPGKYYIRFTYGDRTKKIFKTDGTEVGDATLDDYKSTTVHEDCIRKSLGYNGATGSEEWYKHMTHASDPENVNYSTAVDDLAQRAEYNQDAASRTLIDSYTGLTDISIENEEDSDDIATIDSYDDPKSIEEIKGINFGIIKHPDVNLDLDKVVNNIKITNAQGNIIAEGNPITSNIPYVSNLDADPHIVDGSTYAKAEINEEELYGSTLELKYSITVRNNSAVNYYEPDGDAKYGYYYLFGEITPNAKEVTITIDNVYDFIDSSVKYENLSIDAEHTISKISDLSTVDLTGIDTKKSANVNYDYVVSIKGVAGGSWKEIYTTKNPSRAATETTQETAHLTASRLLSMEDDDLFVSNIAQVVELKITDTPKLVETISKESKYFDSYYTNPTREVYVTVTPPTGKDTITPIVYIITTIIAGVAIAGGVILIKKKVLDK